MFDELVETFLKLSMKTVQVHLIIGTTLANYYDISINKSLLKEAFCLKGGSICRVNDIENMNIFRQDSQTVLFTSEGHFSLERPASSEASSVSGH